MTKRENEIKEKIIKGLIVSNSNFLPQFINLPRKNC